MVYQLYNVKFMVEFGCGSDTWRIVGNCPEHPQANSLDQIMPSTPKSYDPETNIMKTISGSIYEIVSYGNKEKFIEEINKCLEKGRFERC